MEPVRSYLRELLRTDRYGGRVIIRDEHTIILGFIKDICLMVFAFYFGTRSSSPPSPPSEP